MITVLDLVLLVGLTLRLTRFVVADSLARWYLREPANRWAGWDPDYEPASHRQRLVSGLECQYCVGFWIAVLATASLAAAIAFDLLVPWRWVAGAFTLNYVVAHIVGWLDVD